MTTAKYRSIRVNRQNAELHFMFTGEEADYRYYDALPAPWAQDFETLYFKHDPKHWDAMADGYRVISHWGNRHIGEIAEEQRLQARADAKAYRERGEAKKKAQELLEAEQLEQEAATLKQEAERKRKRAADLVTANTQ